MPKVYAVYDDKVGAYMQPFSMESRGQAVRAFSDSVNDPKSIWYRHPGDFQLYELGEFDEKSGEFVNRREFVIAAVDVKVIGAGDPSQLSILDEDWNNGTEKQETA